MIDLKAKKILVTGADGFIGKYLVENLIKERGVPKESIFTPPFPGYDLTKWEDCQKAVKGQEIVLHLAAQTGGIDFHQKNPGKIFYDNIIMNVQLMEAARQAEVKKFIGVGSVTEYPENSPLPFSEKNIWQGFPEEINAPYSFAKKMMLVQAKAYLKQYGFKAVNPLFSNVYGPGMNIKSGYVIFALIKKIEEAKQNNKEYIEIWGTGKATRDFIYLKDAVEGLLLIAEKYESPEPVNIASGKETSIRELAEILARLMKFKGELRFDVSKPEGQMRRAIDISLAKKEFGFKPKTSLEEGLKNAIEWYLTKQNDKFQI